MFLQAHSSVEKAGLIGLVKMRFLPSDENLSLRGDILQTAIDDDLKTGLIPFYVRLQRVYCINTQSEHLVYVRDRS